MNEKEVPQFHREVEDLISQIKNICLQVRTASNSFVVSSYFAECCDRYYFDFALDYKKGWQQFDTSSDAWYFGIWVNTQSMQVLEYCEGDIYLRTYHTRFDMKEALTKLEEFHGEPPPAFISINENGEVSHVYDERPTIQ